ncbi:hypothetical protein G6F58_013099 [Rhizopus delemar]|nr:hypothetical protein G6F58_013099 [Rhizopus delemar]
MRTAGCADCWPPAGSAAADPGCPAGTTLPRGYRTRPNRPAWPPGSRPCWSPSAAGCCGRRSAAGGGRRTSAPGRHSRSRSRAGCAHRPAPSRSGCRAIRLPNARSGSCARRSGPGRRWWRSTGSRSGLRPCG